MATSVKNILELKKVKFTEVSLLLLEVLRTIEEVDRVVFLVDLLGIKITIINLWLVCQQGFLVGVNCLSVIEWF